MPMVLGIPVCCRGSVRANFGVRMDLFPTWTLSACPAGPSRGPAKQLCGVQELEEKLGVSLKQLLEGSASQLQVLKVAKGVCDVCNPCSRAVPAKCTR